MERLDQLNEKLISVSAYSYLVDQREGTNLLVPIANDLRTITAYLNKQLLQQTAITPDAQEVYRYMLQAIAEIEPQIGNVYYVPGVLEGPKVTLKPNRSAVQKMVVSRDRLKEYAAQLETMKLAASASFHPGINIIFDNYANDYLTDDIINRLHSSLQAILDKNKESFTAGFITGHAESNMFWTYTFMKDTDDGWKITMID